MYKLQIIFPTLLLFTLMTLLNGQIDILNTDKLLGPYFDINVSPDRLMIVLSNSNYKTIDIVSKDKINKVRLSNLNSFKCKWSPDSKKILITTADYLDKKRINGLIILDRNGTIIKTIIKGTSEHISPLGWTGNNTFHFMLNEKLVSTNINQMEIEWDTPLVYSKVNKLFIKKNETSNSLLFEANDMILNLSYLPNAEVIVFEVYGHESVIIKNKREIIKDLKDANYLSISEDGNKVVFSKVKDNGHKLTSGDLFIRDMRNGSVFPIAKDNSEIKLNPVWVNSDLVYYIDFQTGLLKSIIVQD